MHNIGGRWLTNLLIVSTLIDQITFLQGQKNLLTIQWFGGTVMVDIVSIEVFPNIFSSTEIHRTVWKFRTQIVVNV